MTLPRRGGVMGRPRKVRARESAITIEPTRIYQRGELPRVMRLGVESIREEVRAGRLKVKLAGGRWLIQGQWILDWLADARGQ